LTPAEMSGLFNWCIPLLKPLIKRGAFTNEMSVADTTKMYITGSDPVGTFIDEYLTEVPNAKLEGVTGWEKYQEFCKANGVYTIFATSVKFWIEMRKSLGGDMHYENGWIGHKAAKCLYGYTFKKAENTSGKARPKKKSKRKVSKNRKQ